MKFKGIFVCLLALTACSKFGSVGYMPEAYNASQPAMEADDAMDSPSGDSFDTITENPFVRVADAPTSSFSVDADGAAYAYMRRCITQGFLPQRNAVRIEEYLNYFTFNYPEPKGEETLAINGEIGPGLPMKTATYRSGTYEIELIEPTGPSIYMDWLNEHGPGIHHVILKTDEKYADVVEMAQRVSGRPPKLETKFPNGIPIVAYVDLQEEAGLLLEIGGNNGMTAE